MLNILFNSALVMETLVRFKDQPGTTETIRFYPNFSPLGALPNVIDVPQVLPSIRERFEECVDNTSSGSRHVWKNWEHYIRSVTVNEHARYDDTVLYGAAFKPYNGQPWLTPVWSLFTNEFGSIDNPVSNGIDPMYVKRSTDNGFVPSPANLNDLLQSAVQSILPQVKEQLSLLNSVYELKDFKSLPHILKDITTLDQLFGLRGVRETLRKLASGVLLSEFAVRPLLSDISNLIIAVRQAEKRINDLVTRQGRVQKRHFTVPLPHQEGVYDESTFKTVSSGPVTYNFYRSQVGLNIRYRYSRQVLHDAYKFHAEMEYNFNYTSYQIAHAQLLGLMDALGLKNSPKIIWNALPWSFVVDWVFGVNRWLKQFETNNMDPQINIIRCLWSVVRDRTLISSIEMRPSSPGLTAVTPSTPVCTITERSYRRNNWLPTTNSITSSGLNLNEFSLGAALVLARRRRR